LKFQKKFAKHFKIRISKICFTVFFTYWPINHVCPKFRENHKKPVELTIWKRFDDRYPQKQT